MRKLLKNMGLLLLSLAIVLTLLGNAIQNYMQSREFIEKISDSVGEFLLADIQVEKTTIRLLKGISIRGISINPPEVSESPFLKITAINAEYRPSVLPARRLEFTKIQLAEPVLRFRQLETGDWWLPSPTSGDGPALGSGLLRFEVILNDFWLRNGIIQVINDRESLFVDARKLDIDGTLTARDSGSFATGSVSLDSLSLGEHFQLRDLTGDIRYENEVLRISHLEAVPYGGTATGLIELDLRLGDPEFNMALQLTEMDLRALMTDLGLVPSNNNSMEGRANIVCQFEGGFEQPELFRGTGTFRVQEASLPDLPMVRYLQPFFREGELPDFRFREMAGNFKVSDKQLTLYSLEALGEDLQLACSGILNFNRKIDLDLRLTLSAHTAARVLPSERASWIERADGALTLTFKLTGTLDEPLSNFPQPRGTDTQTSTQSSVAP